MYYQSEDSTYIDILQWFIYTSVTIYCMTIFMCTSIIKRHCLQSDIVHPYGGVSSCSCSLTLQNLLGIQFIFSVSSGRPQTLQNFTKCWLFLCNLLSHYTYNEISNKGKHFIFALEKRWSNKRTSLNGLKPRLR